MQLHLQNQQINKYQSKKGLKIALAPYSKNFLSYSLLLLVHKSNTFEEFCIKFAKAFSPVTNKTKISNGAYVWEKKELAAKYLLNIQQDLARDKPLFAETRYEKKSKSYKRFDVSNLIDTLRKQVPKEVQDEFFKKLESWTFSNLCV